MAKIINIENFNKLKKSFLKKKKIVMCHGVFDLLHLGHINHFEQARKFGDILIVSVTTDKFVNKGPSRPQFNISQRMQALSSLQSVDYVVSSEFPTAEMNLKKIKPDIFCKGPDYLKNKDLTKNLIKEKKLVLKLGGKIQFTKGVTFSSSKLINNLSGNLDSVQKKYLKKIKNKYEFQDIIDLFNKIKKINVNVLGEIILDKYSYCEPIGISGKDPFLVFKKKDDKSFDGGSLAITKNISNFVKNVNLISNFSKRKLIIKKDPSCDVKSIKLDLVFSKNKRDIIKNRFVDYNTNTKLFGLYTIDDNEIDYSQENEIIKKLKLAKKNNSFIVSDYGHGLISKKISNFLSKNKFNYFLNAQINSSNRGYHGLFKYKNPNSIIINTSELRYEFRDKKSSVEKLILKLQKKLNAQNVVVTMGSSGAVCYSKKDKFCYCPAFHNKIIDKVGAGDSLLAIFSLLKLVGAKNDLALFISSLSAAYQVSVVNNSNFLNRISLLKYLEHILK